MCTLLAIAPNPPGVLVFTRIDGSSSVGFGCLNSKYSGLGGLVQGLVRSKMLNCVVFRSFLDKCQLLCDDASNLSVNLHSLINSFLRSFVNFR
jgi:hypothetical protein